MDNHLIKNITIKNFKCFNDFKIEGFARINLISGKNNVGKTSLMEALYVNVYSMNIKQLTRSLLDIKFTRENLNVLGNNNKYNKQEFIEKSNNISLKSNLNNNYFKINDIDGIKKYLFEFNNEKIEVNVKEFSFEMGINESVNYIDNFGLSNSSIINNYSYIQKKDKEDILNKILNEFDKSIEAFKVIDDKPQCKINNMYLEITEFGDGVRHLISIVTSLYASENGYLFIDEIDNGIHYTKIDDMWKVLIKLSNELNVQIFTTTHSKECIESFHRVNQELSNKEITFTVLNRLKDNSIKAIVRDHDMFDNSMKQERELR